MWSQFLQVKMPKQAGRRPDVAWTPRRVRPELFGACQVRRGRCYGAV